MVNWLCKMQRRMSITVEQVALISWMVGSGRVPPPTLIRPSTLIDPIQCTPVSSRKGNGTFCKNCNRVSTVEASVFTQNAGEVTLLPSWRPIYSNYVTGSEWYHHEKRGRVQCHNDRISATNDIMAFGADEHVYTYTSDRDGEVHMLNSYVECNNAAIAHASTAAGKGVQRAAIAMTTQPMVERARCIWCRAVSTLIQDHLNDTCPRNAVVCTLCGEVYCRGCVKHNCTFSWVQSNTQAQNHVKSIKNMDDFGSQCCDVYRYNVYPGQFAERCSVVARHNDPLMTPVNIFAHGVSMYKDSIRTNNTTRIQRWWRLQLGRRLIGRGQERDP